MISKGVIPTRKGLRIFQAVLRDETGMIEVSWPGQPFLDRTIDKGDVLLVTGQRALLSRAPAAAARVRQPRRRRERRRREGRVLSVYPATEGLSFKLIRSIIDAHLDALLPLVTEYLPADVLATAGVPGIADALRMVHRPSSIAEAMAGRSRLAFEELFFVQLLQQRAKELARERARRHPVRRTSASSRRKLREALPFQLTGAQVRAMREIVADMCSDRRMHRLLQGDVGSGKTIVALFAALLAIENGYQAAIMAPTELLAEQHARTMTALLAPLGIAPILAHRQPAGARAQGDRRAAGERRARARRRHARARAGGDVVRAAGLRRDRRAAPLRRGAAQGARRQGRIARRAAHVGHADPALARAHAVRRSRSEHARRAAAGAPADHDRAAPRSRRATRVLQFIDRQLEAGAAGLRRLSGDRGVGEDRSQGRDDDVRGASHRAVRARVASRCCTDAFRRTSATRSCAAFAIGEIDVLVATTVIEVGIDVANATVMLIEHPERFGLSQLHQLRGRVGRGADESYCILLGDVSPDVAERLAVFTSTEDGFEIAREDLRIRGMGDLFGERQSGVPTFRIADPMRDEELNERARAAAAKLLARDAGLEKPEHAGLRRVLGERYSRSLELFRVG